jgi:hypothetical protein
MQPSGHNIRFYQLKYVDISDRDEYLTDAHDLANFNCHSLKQHYTFPISNVTNHPDHYPHHTHHNSDCCIKYKGLDHYDEHHRRQYPNA